jgi:hypothetical protein
MDTLSIILKSICGLAIAATGLALLSSNYAIRRMLSASFHLIIAVPTLLRDGCRWVCTKIIDFVRASIRSAHSVQKVSVRILLSVCSTASIFVSFAIILLALQSLSGNSTDSILNYLHCSVEALMALDLALAATVFGLLFFESPEQLI